MHVRGEIIIEGEKGDVLVRAFAPPEEIRRLHFDRQFSVHTHYKSLYTRKDSLIKRASQEEANVVVALDNTGNIIGFGVLAYPSPHERWAQLKPRVMMEVIAIEVSREWRSYNIGNAVVEAMLSHPKREEKILYLVGYFWTWDLEGSKKPASEYKKMMIRLFKPFGFIEYKTNEPNICLSPDNLFMARVGSEVPVKIQDDFKWLCFGITP